MPGIEDDRGMKAHVLQPGDHAGGIGEIILVPGEDLVMIHVVDIEGDHIGGYGLFPVDPGDVHDFRFGVITVPALVKPEAPQGREFNGPGE